MWKYLNQASFIQLAFLLASIIFVVYFPSFFNTFIWDDEQFIVKNIYTSSFRYIPQVFTSNTIAGAGETSNYYRPLTTLSFTLDRLVWGLKPFGFHLTNTLLHAAVVILFFIVLKRLTKSIGLSWITALIYGLHPLHTEAVTYINSRGDSLFAMWLLISLICFDKVVLKERLIVSWQEKNYIVSPIWLAVVCLLTFGLSILSKEIAIAGFGLFCLLGMNRYLTQPAKTNRKSLLLVFGLGLLLIMYVGLRLTVLQFGTSLSFYEFPTEYSQFLSIRLLTFSRVLVQYCQLILFPYPLHMERDIEFVKSIWSIWPWLVLISSAGWIWLSRQEWVKKRTTLIGLGGLWFLVMLVPVSGIIPINGILYEHWLYVPLMGVLIATIGVWRIISQPNWRVPGKWLILGLALMYSALTVRQNWLWRHPIPFYTYTLKYAESARLNNNLAMAYAEAGDQEQAIGYYRKALRQSNQYPQIYYNLARSYLEIGDIKAAIENAQLALQIRPDFLYAYSFLAEIYLQQSQYEMALPLLAYLSQAMPNDTQIGLVYGQTLFITGRRQEAEEVWSHAYQQSGSDFRLLQAINSFKQMKASQAQ